MGSGTNWNYISLDVLVDKSTYGLPVVKVSDYFNIFTANHFYSFVQSLNGRYDKSKLRNSGLYIFDFSDVKYADTAAVASMISLFYKENGFDGKRAAMIDPGGVLKEVFGLCRCLYYRRLRFYNDIDNLIAKEQLDVSSGNDN